MSQHDRNYVSLAFPFILLDTALIAQKDSAPKLQIIFAVDVFVSLLFRNFFMFPRMKRKVEASRYFYSFSSPHFAGAMISFFTILLFMRDK
jgi:hypothetical protein